MIEGIITLFILYYVFGIGVGVGMNKAVGAEHEFDELLRFGLTWPKVFIGKD